MAPLPLLKLGALLVKTLAKPVANRIKVEARKHPQFSALCTAIGQLSHQATSRLYVLASGYRVLAVDPLPAEEALARGINFVSESFIFAVAGGILVFEYQRGESKAAAKAMQKQEEERAYQAYVDNRFQLVYGEIKSLSARLDAVERRLREEEQRSRWFALRKNSGAADPVTDTATVANTATNTAANTATDTTIATDAQSTSALAPAAEPQTERETERETDAQPPSDDSSNSDSSYSGWFFGWRLW